MLLPEYDLFFSLGRFCHTRILLEGAGLSRQCGPWDWSGTPVAEGVYKRLRMLVDGFDDFFRREDFVDLALHPEFSTDYWEIYRHALNNQWPHLCLFNRRTFSWYVHDGHRVQSIDEQFETLRQKYMTRAQRFMHRFHCAERILAVYASNAVDQRIDLCLDPKIVRRLLAEVRANFPEKRIDLAVFQHDDSKFGSNITSEPIDHGYVEFYSNHYFSPPEPWLQMKGYRMPMSIAQTLRNNFSESDLLQLV